MNTILDVLSAVGETCIIDISDGVEVENWGEVAKHVTGEYLPRIDGVIMRMTEAHIFDDDIFKHYRGFKDIGMNALGVYAWHNPRKDHTKDIAQAAKFAEGLDMLGEIPPLGCYEDLETNPDKMSHVDMRQSIWSFINRFESLANVQCKIYTRGYWWKDNVANKVIGWTQIPIGMSKDQYKPRGRGLWVSHPDSPPPLIEVDDWTQRYGSGVYEFHQYTWKLRIKGIRGMCDGNSFNGSLSEFHTYFGVDSTPSPPPAQDIYGEFIIDGISLRNAPVYGANTLVGKGIKGRRVKLGESVINGYRDISGGCGTLWAWDASIKKV